jgi:hypothetical protein
MGEICTATFKEIMKSFRAPASKAHLGLSTITHVQVSGNADVTAKNQYLGIVCVLNVKVSEFKM